MEAYSQIGQLLSSARREMRLSVDQAAQILHIRPRYIIALEEGRLEDLPGLSYAKGYLQTYATFLHLDRVEVLRRFEQVEQSVARQRFYLPDSISKEKTPSQAMVWGGLAAAVLLYGIWWVGLSPGSGRFSVLSDWLKAPAPHYDGACFQEQDVIYPPCYWPEDRFDLLPLHRQQNSVMEPATLFQDV